MQVRVRVRVRVRIRVRVRGRGRPDQRARQMPRLSWSPWLGLGFSVRVGLGFGSSG